MRIMRFRDEDLTGFDKADQLVSQLIQAGAQHLSVRISDMDFYFVLFKLQGLDEVVFRVDFSLTALWPEVHGAKSTATSASFMEYAILHEEQVLREHVKEGWMKGWTAEAVLSAIRKGLRKRAEALKKESDVYEDFLG